MHPVFAFLLVATTSALLTADQVATSPDGKLAVSLLPAEVQKEFDGCGCYFQAGAEENLHPRYLTGWSLGDERKVPLRLSGRTERLIVEQIDTGINRPSRIGDSVLFKLRNPRVRADLFCKVIQDCVSLGSPSCEYTGYSCSAVIESAGSRIDLSATGYCGC